MEEEEEEERKKSATCRVVTGDEEGRKKVGKVEVKSVSPDKIRYIAKKMAGKGVLRLERHPVDGLGGLGHAPHKRGHGGKYTWEGPRDPAESELSAPPAIDERDPNYVEEEDKIDEEEVSDLVVGEVEVAKIAEVKEGAARVEVQAPLLLPPP